MENINVAEGTAEKRSSKDDVLLEIKNLKKYFPVSVGFLKQTKGYVKAVDNVSLKVGHGETLGLVGESGSGKTTLGRCVVRLYQPMSGEVLFHITDDKEEEKTVDLAKLTLKEIMPYRRQFQMIFQDPYASLNPSRTVFDTISEPIQTNHLLSHRGLEERVIHLMNIVGLETRYLRRYPHAFSGGQRQRIGIARALATNPRLIVADEPVSALDVSIQSQILNLLKDLQQEFGLSYLFVAHDLNVVRYISHRVAVMYVGQIVELATTDELFRHPIHPYTEALLSAVPVSEPDEVRKRILLQGEIPNPASPPSGCYFHPRCQYAEDVCKKENPIWEEVRPEHYATCHFAKTLDLRGVA